MYNSYLIYCYCVKYLSVWVDLVLTRQTDRQTDRN